jgi:hypothetical protein
MCPPFRWWAHFFITYCSQKKRRDLAAQSRQKNLLQSGAGSLEFGEAVDPVLLALAVLGDDFGGGVLDEGFAGELAGDFFDFGFDFGYLGV